MDKKGSWLKNAQSFLTSAGLQNKSIQKTIDPLLKKKSPNDLQGYYKEIFFVFSYLKVLFSHSGSWNMGGSLRKT